MAWHLGDRRLHKTWRWLTQFEEAHRRTTSRRAMRGDGRGGQVSRCSARFKRPSAASSQQHDLSPAGNQLGINDKSEGEVKLGLVLFEAESIAA